MPARHSILNFKFSNAKHQAPLILNSLRSKGGFTLLELMITISIIAILSAIGITSFNQSQKLGRDSKRKSDLKAIATALEFYKQKNGRYPCHGWAFSNNPASPWITDENYNAVCDGTKPDLDVSYMATLPRDPINVGANPWTAGNYIYGYRSYDCVTNGQYYFLLAQLENYNDPDRAALSSAKWCDGSNIATNPAAGVNATAYVISSY